MVRTDILHRDSDMAREVAEAVAAGTPAGLPPQRSLQAGSHANFAAMAEGGRARVLLVDAPAVLSPAQLAELSRAAGSPSLREGLKACLRPGQQLPLNKLAGLRSAAFDRAALAVALGEDTSKWSGAMNLLLRTTSVELAR